MESSSTSSRRLNRGGMEENILALLDATDSKDTQDANDDRIAFLQAVRVACLSPNFGFPPTYKMCEAVFQILRLGKSMELIMESFWLLIELDKRFPQVYLSDKGVPGSSELVVVEEAWLPLVFNLDTIEKGDACRGPLDSSGFHLLIQDLAEVVRESNSRAIETKSLGNMLLFQYIVNILEADFVPRKKVYDETMNWILLRESLLSMLLGSRKINYKGLMKACLSTICGLRQVSTGTRNDFESPDNSMEEPSQNDNIALKLALLHVGNDTCTAMEKFLTLIMELDISRKIADMQGCTSRVDGVRTPLLEIIMDELTYDRDMLFPFLQIFGEPKWKLEIILQYFSKYIPKSSVRTRRSNGSAEDVTFAGVLKCFSNISQTRNITKRISMDVVQVLLAHAFEAYTSLSTSQQDADSTVDSSSEVRGSGIMAICEDIISAFRSLKSIDEKMEILPFGEEALFTAATILSTMS